MNTPKKGDSKGPVWPAPESADATPPTLSVVASPAGEPLAAQPRQQPAHDVAVETDGRSETALDLWRRKLLDLTKRNRALNFRTTKVSTLTIVDEQPVEVFRHLCIEAKPMRFAPTLPSEKRQNDENGAPSLAAQQSELTEPPAIPEEVGSFDSDDTDADDVAGADFAPYDPDTLDDRYTDDILQTQATPEALDKTLRRLDEQARGTLEEQGVNTLFIALGTLYYSESTDSADVLRAPLIMVPVELSRRSARTGYTVRATDEDAIVNPALSEHLNRMFAVSLPELPAADDPTAGDALQTFFANISEVAADRTRAGFKGWAVKTEIYMGFFAFQKLVMFKDLEKNATPFARHRLVRQLVNRDAPPGTYLMGLPGDVRDLELDDAFPPESTAQVVDADGSQLRAIAAVAKGHDLVIEGPPGTGKSQTITNLIAQALSDGKSVLFVAEKMAALQVVQRRLANAGLGEFCLELHAAKANKRTVMQELRTALDASLQTPDLVRRTHRLPTVRRQLSTYANAVHAVYGRLGISPYSATGLLGEVCDAPRCRLEASIADLTLESLQDIKILLDDLAAAQVPVGLPSRHAWRDTTRTFYAPGAKDDVGTALSSALEAIEQVVSIADKATHTYATPPIARSGDLAMLVSVAEALEQSPGAPLAVLQSEAWNAAPPEAASLIEQVRVLQRWRKDISIKLTDDVLDQEHASDIAYVEQKASGILGFLAILDGRYRSIKRRWEAYRAAGYSGSPVAQATLMRLVDKYTRQSAQLGDQETYARDLFGALWRGQESDCATLQRYVEWVVKMRGLCVQFGLSNEALGVASHAGTDTKTIRELEKAGSVLSERLEKVRTAVGWPAGYLGDAPYDQQRQRLQAMRGDLAGASAWATFEQVRTKAAQTIAEELVARAMENTGSDSDLPFAALSGAFQRAVMERFLEEVLSEREPLREFKTLTHEQRVKEFRKLDEWILSENQAAVVSRLRRAAQDRLQQSQAREGLPFLQSQMVRQRNIAPLRRLLQQSESTVRAIKPCFLMSPLTVAQLLDGRTPTFDLVIFDEASQLPSEDAIGAICRGKQLVVVGDPKQLPPTSFFAAQTGPAAPPDDDGLPVIQDGESVLEEYMGAGIPVTRLKWHYRSAHESLITFSNVSFYDSDLYTFPSVETGGDNAGLSFEFVHDGVYEGKGINRAEARRVADAVVQHAKLRPGDSLCVGTFNMRQQLAVLDELELRRRQDPSIEPFFTRGAAESFFVKNLENIQGDERDVVFLSVTYGKSLDGKLRYQFGPLNGENGWRRLNVLATRARKRMRVFASMHGDDINAAATTARGAQLLREFLLYAEYGRLDSAVANAAAKADSRFEAEVMSELTRRGIRVVPQVGAAGYRIDIGILDDAIEGRFICGIECDGVAYHSSQTARDRDRLRQQVLEARGWIIHRVWSTDWFKDRSTQIERLLELIESARVKTRERLESEAQQVADARLAAEQAQPAAVEALEAPSTQSGNAKAGRSYVRPTVSPYQFAPGAGRYAGVDLLETPTSQVSGVVVEVVEAEGPIHEHDLTSRVASVWGLARVGSRVAAKVASAVQVALDKEAVVAKGEFLWHPALAANPQDMKVRNRSGTRLTGAHVTPEEVLKAVCMVLAAGGIL